LVDARQFNVYRVKGLKTDSAVDLAVVLQDDTLSHLSTRVVGPLIPIPKGLEVERATPAVSIDGVRYMVAVHLVTTIPSRNLGTLVASLADHDRELKNAIDMVFFGV
jgi:toxin CcdB